MTSYLYPKNKSVAKRGKLHNSTWEVFNHLEQLAGVSDEVMGFGCSFLFMFCGHLLFSAVSVMYLIYLGEFIILGKFQQWNDPFLLIFIAIVTLGYLIFWGIPDFYKLYTWRKNDQLIKHHLAVLIDTGKIYDGVIIKREIALSLFMDLTYQFTLKTGQTIIGTYRVDDRRRAEKLSDTVHILAVDERLHLLI